MVVVPPVTVAVAPEFVTVVVGAAAVTVVVDSCPPGEVVVEVAVAVVVCPPPTELEAVTELSVEDMAVVVPEIEVWVLVEALTVWVVITVVVALGAEDALDDCWVVREVESAEIAVVVEVVAALLGWRGNEPIKPQPATKEVATATNSMAAKATLNLFKES
jgi:hypothetical protein